MYNAQKRIPKKLKKRKGYRDKKRTTTHTNKFHWNDYWNERESDSFRVYGNKDKAPNDSNEREKTDLMYGVNYSLNKAKRWEFVEKAKKTKIVKTSSGHKSWVEIENYPGKHQMHYLEESMKKMKENENKEEEEEDIKQKKKKSSKRSGGTSRANQRNQKGAGKTTSRKKKRKEDIKTAQMNELSLRYFDYVNREDIVEIDTKREKAWHKQKWNRMATPPRFRRNKNTKKKDVKDEIKNFFEMKNRRRIQVNNKY